MMNEAEHDFYMEAQRQAWEVEQEMAKEEAEEKEEV